MMPLWNPLCLNIMSHLSIPYDLSTAWLIITSKAISFHTMILRHTGHRNIRALSSFSYDLTIGTGTLHVYLYNHMKAASL